MAALIQYHGDGVQTELVHLEYAEICAAIELEKCESSDTVEEIQAHWLTILSSHWLYNLEINGQHQRKQISSVHRRLYGHILTMVGQRSCILL